MYYPALAMIWLMASLISSLHLFLSLTQDYFEANPISYHLIAIVNFNI